MTTFETKFEFTGEPVVVKARLPEGHKQRKQDRMEGLKPDSLIFMPGYPVGVPQVSSVEYAAVLVNDAPELELALEASGVDLPELLDLLPRTPEYEDALNALLADGDRVISLLNRDGWEFITDDENCCECQRRVKPTECLPQ